MKTTQRKPLAPIDCNTCDEVCQLQTDHADCGDFWILNDGYTVSIARQKDGEPPQAEISIPKKKFDALIKWYTTGKSPRKSQEPPHAHPQPRD